MAKKFVPNPEIAKANVKTALAQLNAGVEGMRDSDAWKAYLATAARFHQYSFCNTVLILAQRPGATLIAGYNKWRSMKRFVKAGEHGLHIFAPNFVHKVDVDSVTGEATEKVLRFFRAVSVFDVSQTDGEPLPTADTIIRVLDGDGGDELLAELWGYAEALGLEIVETDTGSRNGYLLDAQVALQATNPALQRAKTLVHEMAHFVLGHSGSGVGKDLRECEAESVAYAVMCACGFDASDYSFGYLATWLQDVKDVKAAMLKVGARVQAAVDKILSAKTAERIAEAA